jgi:hypothetical protein
MSLLLNYLNAAAYATNLFVTYGVGAGGVFGTPSNGELSAKYQTIVTPAGWAFSIWGIIFVSELIWTLYQLTPAYRYSPLVREGVSWYFIGVCAAQIAWTLMFSFEFIAASLAAMLSILYCLVKIVTTQYKLDDNIPTRDYWLLKFPFSIHAAWIVAASLVNTNLVLVKFQASADVQYTAALMSLGVLLLITTYVLHLTSPDFVVPLVSAWALVRSAIRVRVSKIRVSYSQNFKLIACSYSVLLARSLRTPKISLPTPFHPRISQS